MEKETAVTKKQTAGTRGASPPRAPPSSKPEKARSAVALDARRRAPPTSRTASEKAEKTLGKKGGGNIEGNPYGEKPTPPATAQKRPRKWALVRALSPHCRLVAFSRKETVFATAGSVDEKRRPSVIESAPRNLFPRSLGKPISPKSGSRVGATSPEPPARFSGGKRVVRYRQSAPATLLIAGAGGDG